MTIRAMQATAAGTGGAGSSCLHGPDCHAARSFLAVRRRSVFSGPENRRTGPQVLQRIRTPRPPRLSQRCGAERVTREAHVLRGPAGPRDRSAGTRRDHRGPQPDVGHGPRPDALDGEQWLGDGVPIGPASRTTSPDARADASPIMALARAAGTGSCSGASAAITAALGNKHVSEPCASASLRPCSAARRPATRTGAGHAHLLAEHRPECQLIAIDMPWRPETRHRSNRRAETGSVPRTPRGPRPDRHRDRTADGAGERPP